MTGWVLSANLCRSYEDDMGKPVIADMHAGYPGRTHQIRCTCTQYGLGGSGCWHRQRVLWEGSMLVPLAIRSWETARMALRAVLNEAVRNRWI